MKETGALLRYTGLWFLLLVFAPALLTGCRKDVDEEVCEIEDEINRIARDLNDLRTKLGENPVQAVSFEDGRITVTTWAGGTVSYEVGADMTAFDLRPDGRSILVNGEEVGRTDGDENPEQIDIMPDGTVVADGVPQSFRAIPDAQSEAFIAFIRTRNGSIVRVRIKEGEACAILDLAPSPVVTSLTYIPTHTDGLLGDVEFFPVIVYDEYSQVANAPVFPYNGASKALHESFVPGWLTMRYRVNPGHLAPDAIESYAFDHRSAYVSAQGRGAAPGLEVKAGAATDEGVLSVALRGLRMLKWSGNGSAMPGSEYDDPHGVPSDGSYGEAIYQTDLLALQTTNRRSGFTGGGSVVTSDYTPVKRLVIRQRDIELGLAVQENGQTPAAVFRDLSDMYTGAVRRVAFSADPADYAAGIIAPSVGTTWSAAAHDKAANDYKIAMPVQLRLLYWETLREQGQYFDLDAAMRHYFVRYATNTGRTSGTAQYDFSDFGFPGMFERRYAIEGYDNGHTNPSTGAPIYGNSEVMKYMHLTEDGKISFPEGNTSAIGREPVIRVELRAKEDGSPVMTKLLKIRITDYEQQNLTLTVDHVKNQSITCGTVYGAEIAGRYIDLDVAYNAAGMSKTNFEIAYGAPQITVMRNGTPETHRVTFAPAAPFDQRIAMTVETDAIPGNYTVQVTYTLPPSNPTAPYKTITLNDSFTLSYPSGRLTREPSAAWDETDPDAPFFTISEAAMSDPTDPASLEDAFTAAGLAYGCGTLRFEAVEPASGVTVTRVNGKHRLSVTDPALYGQPLLLRAYFTHQTTPYRGNVLITKDGTSPLYPNGGQSGNLGLWYIVVMP